MIILAIDPAARTGWCIADTTNDQLDYGVWPLGNEPETQLLRLEDYLTRAIEKFRPSVVAYESATFGSRHLHAMRKHNQKAGVIELVAGRMRCDVWSFTPTQWKAIALTAGNLDKPGVMRALRIVYGIEVNDEDIADAIGIVKAAAKGRPPLSKKKQRRAAEKKLVKMQAKLFR